MATIIEPVRAVYYGRYGQYGRCMVHTPAGAAGAWFIRTAPTCPYNMVNFGQLAAEIVSLVWGTPANFNGFLVLTALLHGTLLVGAAKLRR